ncbi:MAG: LysM peptidoglycan-binding domain-containing protein [Gammaproteobacteria bacterium]|nr:LysM peptidoglycan-binding domain-containing protein [Gammaproteobacteria bacterium]
MFRSLRLFFTVLGILGLSACAHQNTKAPATSAKPLKSASSLSSAKQPSTTHTAKNIAAINGDQDAFSLDHDPTVFLEDSELELPPHEFTTDLCCRAQSEQMEEIGDHLANPSKATLLGSLPGQRRLRSEIEEEIAFETGGDEAVITYDQEGDLWGRIRQGLTLRELYTHAGVQRDLDWYLANQEYFDRVVERARPYLYYIVSEMEKAGLPLEIALLPVVESAFQPFAYSHGRAAGLWQFIPGTGKRYGLKQNWWYDGRRDIVSGTRAAISYFKDLGAHFNNDWALALAAYNSGEGTVLKAIQKNRRKKKPTDYWSLKLPAETRGYVPKLLAVARIIDNPKALGMRVASIPNEPYFDVVKVNGQIDLALAADLAGLTVEDIYTLNPAYNRWATDPSGPHRLLLPLEVVDTFMANLSEVPDDQLIRWERHTVRRGDTLNSIASTYRTNIQVIKTINELNGIQLKAGNDLMVPVAARDSDSYTLSAEQRLRTLQNSAPRGRDKSIHLVLDGETLWSIAQQYDVDMRALARWNGMAPRDTLSTGQQLVVWTRNGENLFVKVNADAKLSPFDSSITQRKITYRVRRGDSLGSISRRFKVSIENMVQWNPRRVKKHARLRPGQRITLYVDVTRQSG